MMYSSVSSTEQRAQISHRLEIKKTSISLLAQGHTEDGDQQDQNYLPKQIRSAGVGHCYGGWCETCQQLWPHQGMAFSSRADPQQLEPQAQALLLGILCFTQYSNAAQQPRRTWT